MRAVQNPLTEIQEEGNRSIPASTADDVVQGSDVSVDGQAIQNCWVGNGAQEIFNNGHIATVMGREPHVESLVQVIASKVLIVDNVLGELLVPFTAAAIKNVQGARPDSAQHGLVKPLAVTYHD